MGSGAAQERPTEAARDVAAGQGAIATEGRARVDQRLGVAAELGYRSATAGPSQNSALGTARKALADA
jgi:hypothetical protein